MTINLSISKETFVYCIRSNARNDRFYFGISRNPHVRLREHFATARRGGTSKISMAIRKYGEDTFYTTVLKSFSDRFAASSAEQEIIAAYGGPSGGLLWNGTTGGDSGYAFPDAERRGKLISKALQKPEIKAKKRKIAKAVWDRDGAREAHSKRLREYYTNKDVSQRTKKITEIRRSVSSRLEHSFFIKGISKTNPDDIVAFLSIREAMRSGYDESCLYKCLIGKRKLHRNRRWVQISEDEGMSLRPDLLFKLQKEQSK